jgi:serine/threonine-protein kinase
MHSRRIGPPPQRTPSGEPRGEARAMPDDLLREASLRLGIMSLLGAVLWIVATAIGHVVYRATIARTSGVPYPTETDWIAAVSALVSLVLFFYTRKKDLDPAFVLNLGLAYLVLMAMALGTLFHWVPVAAGKQIEPQISWIGAVVLMFAAIVPNRPSRIAIAGLIAVSMNPVGMLIARSRGTWPFESASTALVMHWPDYLMVGVAVVIANVVTSLGQQVAKAREMGSYRLGELLGRGGMGEVYAATHLMLARPAAIKLIRPEVLGAADDESTQLAVRRFRREAEVAASLRSPHTVELYDFGVTENQTFYFVMEMLDGMDLESLVEQTGPLPAARVIYIIRQVCASLEEAHVRGLVHRDIKPANIHIGRLGLEYDFVKVLDFGLVKRFKGRSDELTQATAVGLTPGTPAYMAPEMTLGETVDGRADLYALGCVAYYLLTGGPVFDAMTSFELIAKHMRDVPPPPSQRTTLPVPKALDAIVLTCLAKKPEDRVQTAAELSRALAAIDGDVWDENRARQWWKEHDLA